MTRVRLLLAVAALTTCCPLSARGQSGALPARQVHPPVPPPPPIIYDPQPGPFIVHADQAGNIDQDQYPVIKNAVLSWSGPNLQAFIVCFRSADAAEDWRSARRALEIVVQQLKLNDAKVVAVPYGSFCDANAPRPTWRGSYVQIMGVVQR